MSALIYSASRILGRVESTKLGKVTNDKNFHFCLASKDPAYLQIEMSMAWADTDDEQVRQQTLAHVDILDHLTYTALTDPLGNVFAHPSPRMTIQRHSFQCALHTQVSNHRVVMSWEYFIEFRFLPTLLLLTRSYAGFSHPQTVVFWHFH